MIRYAVRYTSLVDNSIQYESIGKGSSEDRQDAHLYTKIKFAETKAKYYRDQPQWYEDVTVVPVEVIWPE